MSLICTYDKARLFKTSVALTPLIVCPLLISKFWGHSDLILVLFGTISAIWLAGVVLTALRFKLIVTDDALTCRGRFTQRTISFSDITSVSLRQGRDRAGRSVGTSPLRELVINTHARTFVVSSIPLGNEAMEAVIENLQQNLPAQLWSSERS